MHLRVAGIVLLAMAGIAAADPPQSCRELPAAAYGRLPPAAQQKLASTQRFAQGRRDWKHLLVTVSITRAPHIAREILSECPGVVAIDTAQPLDVRRFQSQVRLHVASYAALARIGQLPAVGYVSVMDPADVRMKRMKPPMPDIDFE